MKAVLIFGAFNPVTKAHVRLGRLARRKFGPCDVIYIPASNDFLRYEKRLDKDDLILSDYDRVLLLRKSVEKYGFKVVTYEVDDEVSGKTIDTVEKIKSDLGYDEIYICMGTDKISELYKWHRAEDLLYYNKFIFVERDGESVEEEIRHSRIRAFEDNFYGLKNNKFSTISSTEIREAYKNNELRKVVYYVPRVVYNYLVKRRKNMTNYELEKEKVVLWIKKWFEKNGPDSPAVIGISGGKDSTIMAALCVEALGRDRVFGVKMPQHYQDDIDDSDKVIRCLGIRSATVNIGNACDIILDSVKGCVDNFTPQTKMNLSPRIRMATLYALSQSMNGRVACTCNLSERMIGWETIWGDAVGDFAPFANLTATDVIEIGKLCHKIPSELVVKAPSDGLCGQTDEDRFGFTYAELDNYLKYGVKGDNFDKIEKMIKGSEFKRIVNMPMYEPKKGH